MYGVIRLIKYKCFNNAFTANFIQWHTIWKFFKNYNNIGIIDC